MEKKPQPAILSKKHIARLERERRQARTIRWVALIVILSVIGLIGYGLLDLNVLQPKKPIAKVNGEPISLRTFQVRTRLYRQNKISEYNQYYFYTQMGMDMSQQLQEITYLLDPEMEASSEQIAATVIDSLVDEVLVKQEAKKLGITVTDEELETYIREFYSYYPDGTPTTEPTGTAVIPATLSAEQLSLVTITPTSTRIPTQTPDPSATATPVPSPTSPSTPEPTATAYTLEGYQTLYNEKLTEFSDSMKMTETDFRDLLRYQLLRDKMVEEVGKDVPTTHKMIWARHILVADGAVASVIRQRLIKGEDFATVAAEVSIDPGSKDSGGDLGWFAEGAMIPEFEDAAFSQKIGEIGQPVKSQYGYHIIQVLGQDTRPLTASELKSAQEEAFSEWLAKVRKEAEANIVKYDDFWKANIPVEPTLPPQQSIPQ